MWLSKNYGNSVKKIANLFGISAFNVYCRVSDHRNQMQFIGESIKSAEEDTNDSSNLC